MADVTCDAVREVAAELALGTLEGTERGEALAHLAGCHACRAHVQELAEVVDKLLAVAPEAEPPAGFESAVVERIAVPGRHRSAGVQPRRRVVALAAAAVVLVLLGVGTGLALGRGQHGDQTRDGGTLARATMDAPGGEQVGEVWRYGDEDAVVFVSVPAWSEVDAGGPNARRYALRLELVDGGTVEVGDFGLGGGVSSWGASSGVAGDDIAAVSVVDDTGRVWCTGHFA